MEFTVSSASTLRNLNFLYSLLYTPCNISYMNILPSTLYFILSCNQIKFPLRHIRVYCFKISVRLSEYSHDLWLDIQVKATSLPTSDLEAFALTIKLKLLYFYFHISFVYAINVLKILYHILLTIKKKGKGKC